MLIGNITVNVGDAFVITETGYRNGFGVSGSRLIVKCIIDRGTIGMYSKKKVNGWHELDGRVEHGHGYYFTEHNFMDGSLKKESTRFIINEAFSFNNMDLTGKECVLLHTDKDTTVCFVELEENVGAGSADGLGKQGHCVMIPYNKLTPTEEVSEAKRANQPMPPKPVTNAVSNTQKQSGRSYPTTAGNSLYTY